MLHLPWKVIFQHHANFTKYRTCHKKWYSNITPSPNIAPVTKSDFPISCQRHQILHLPRKVIFEHHSNFTKYYVLLILLPTVIKSDSATLTEKRMKSAHYSAADPTLIRAWARQPATRRAFEVTFCALAEAHFVLKNATFRPPAFIPKFTNYCACHEKWHCNFTNSALWEVTLQHHRNFTKYCACHKMFFFTLLFFDSTILSYYSLTLLFFYSSMLSLY